MFSKNTFIAVHAVEEPFYIAQCSEMISRDETSTENKTFKVKWLDRATVKKDGSTIYNLSYEDQIYYGNIITSVRVRRLTRFKFVLDISEISNILVCLGKSPTAENCDSQYEPIFDIKRNTKRATVQTKTYDETSVSFYDISKETDSISRGKSLELENVSFATLISPAVKESPHLSKSPSNSADTASTKKLDSITGGHGSNVTNKDNLLEIGDHTMYELENVSFATLISPAVKESPHLSKSPSNSADTASTKKLDSITGGHGSNVTNKDNLLEIGDHTMYELENVSFATLISPAVKESPHLSKSPSNSADTASTKKLDSITGGHGSNVTNKDNLLEIGDHTMYELENVSFATLISPAVKESLQLSNSPCDSANTTSTEKLDYMNGGHETIYTVKDGDLLEIPDNPMNDQDTEAKVIAPSTGAELFSTMLDRNGSNIDIQKDLQLEEIHNFQDYSTSGTEYIPQSNGSSDIDSDVPCGLPSGPRIQPDKKKSNFLRTSVSSSSCGEPNEPDDIDSEGPSIFVDTVKKTQEGKRVYNKKHSCYFCQMMYNKLTRHLENKHSEEIEVAKLLAIKKKDKRRTEGFLLILRAGDYYHNCEVFALKTGELILSRRPVRSIDFKKYGPCPNCLGFFLLSTLWHHVKFNCPKKTNVTEECIKSPQGAVTRRDIRGESMALLGAPGDYDPEFKKNILATFKDDDVSEICKSDAVIMRFGSLLFEKHNRHQHEYIRQCMRQLARLILAIQSVKLSKQISLQESMLPKNFDQLVLAVKNLCLLQKSDIGQQDFGVPSLALKLGHNLRKCALVAKGIALRTGDLQTEKEMTSFLELMTMEWNSRVSCGALRTLRQRKLNSTELLPVTDDLMKLNRYLEDVMRESMSKITFNTNSQLWARLAGATLCRIILFNKRRSGEASRMTMNQYSSRPSWQDSTAELKATLTPIEQNLAERLSMVEVIGKSRALTKVPVLLTADTKQAIDKLIETRIPSGISKDNVYVFARGSGSEGYLRGHDALRTFCNEISLQQPELVTSTKLRKYVATVVQLFDLKENEYDWLARHLGHDIRVHRQFYRLHESAVELTKVSRILLAVDQGEANRFSGKTLDEINVTDLPNVEDSDMSDLECAEPGDGYSGRNEEHTSQDTSTTQVTKTCIQNKERTTTTHVKRPWGKSEKQAALAFFSLNVKREKVPTKSEIEDCLKTHDKVLGHRSWREIKYCVYNHIQTTKKRKK